MSLSSEEILSVEKIISEKPDGYQCVEKLLNIYRSLEKNGIELVRASLNKELISLNTKLSDKTENYDIVLDKIAAIGSALRKLPKDDSKKESSGRDKKHDKEGSKKKSIFEESADKNR